MNFADLYRFSNELTGDEVSVESLRKLVKDRHPTVDDVIFWGCGLDQNISRGHMILQLDRSSPYEDEYITASVRFDMQMNRCWARFVCCKELMHVFDKSLEKTSSKDRYLKLMSELENNPIASDSSPMFDSERNAEWMAIIALCPPRLRNQHLESYKDKSRTALEIATAVGIPEALIRNTMNSSYERAVEILTGEPIS